MSNLPITTSAPQTAAKTVQAAAPAEDAAPQGQPFGDVLARQVSDATTETAPLTKKASGKTAEEIFADIQATDAAAAPAAGDAATTNLPVDMLATLLPPGANIATRGKAPKDASALADQASTPQEIGALNGLIGQPAQAVSATETAGLSKQPAFAATAQTGMDATQGAAATTKGAAGKNIPGMAQQPLIEAKKDAAFTSMMATMNANMADKLSHTDEKAAALAAAPQPNAANLASVQAANTLNPAVVLPAVVTIDTPVSHDKWGDEFNQKITWLANTKEQSAELHLNPPQLGPMDVVLKVNGDQATALFTSPHAAVRDAIEQALPKLREMMADSGIMLGNATVSDNSRNQQNESGNKNSGPRPGIGGITDTSAASSQSMRVSPISRHNGIVDTFA